MNTKIKYRIITNNKKYRIQWSWIGDGDYPWVWKTYIHRDFWGFLYIWQTSFFWRAQRKIRKLYKEDFKSFKMDFDVTVLKKFKDDFNTDNCIFNTWMGESR